MLEKLSRFRVAVPFKRSTFVWLSCRHGEMEKKNREENNFSSRVEVRVVTPKKSGVVSSASGLMPFLLR
jgi:hypothetical protein